MVLMIESIVRFVLFFTFITAAAVSYYPLASAQAQQPGSIVIGYPARSIGSIQLFIAQEKGFFQEEALQVHLLRYAPMWRRSVCLPVSCLRTIPWVPA
jgi:ABC-type nitrate/sulfonate/bicarbonate transport system substrate-binding protein